MFFFTNEKTCMKNKIVVHWGKCRSLLVTRQQESKKWIEMVDGNCFPSEIIRYVVVAAFLISLGKVEGIRGKKEIWIDSIN